MARCYSCGNDEPDNLLYCTKCGKQLELRTFEHQAGTMPYIPGPTEAMPAVTEVLPARSTRAPAGMPARRRSSALWLLLLLPVVGLCALGGFLFKVVDYVGTQTSPTPIPVPTLDTNAIVQNMRNGIRDSMANYNATMKQIAENANAELKKAKMIGHERAANNTETH